MSERWIRVTDGDGTRRCAILSGLTRIGGAGADVPLAGVGDDQVHLWDEPPRLVFVGGGVPPAFRGVPFAEREVGTGDRIDWQGAVLEFDFGEAAIQEVREIAEIAEVAPSVQRPRSEARASGAGGASASDGAAGAVVLSEGEGRIWTRVRAGLYVDLGLSDRDTTKRWQKTVLEGEFSADTCAREIVETARTDSDELVLMERAGRLMRDFLMSAYMQGARGAGRSARKATKSGVAFLLAQGLALLVFAIIVLLCLAFIRMRGVSLDGFFDAFLPSSPAG